MDLPAAAWTYVWHLSVPHRPRAGAAPSQEDINKELGVGAVSADMQLDALKDAADAEILAITNGLGRYVPLIASFCRSRCVMQQCLYSA